MNPSQTRSRPRSPGFVYGGMTLAMIVLIGVIALVSRQPPPPTIAEFAPQALENIEDAPDEQSSDFGRGPGAGGDGGDGGPTPVPTPGPRQFIDVNRTNRCIGEPPRQTEDPQSPPCVPYWAGDNGGATSKGVTGAEIRVAFPANAENYGEPMLAHFNSRYEFYGRRIVDIGGVDVEEGHTTESMMAAAAQVDSKNAFASTMYGDAGGNESVFYNELARRKIVSVDGRPSMAHESEFARHHPYRWAYLPSHDKMQRNEAEWICQALKNRPAEFASGRELTYPARKFGLVYTVTKEGVKPNLDALKAGLAGCGITFTDETQAEMIHNEGDGAGVQRGQSVVIRMQLEEVTTIICACHTQSSGLYLYPNATKQGYYPEWIVGTYMYQAEDSHAATWDGAQVENTFGLSWWSKQLAPQDMPFYWAVKEGDPNAQIQSAFQLLDARWLYNSLLILASGVQLAGPNLTPDTFARGLQSATWPNPNAGEAPYWQGTISFRGDHTAVEDAALVWLSRSQRSSWNYPGGAACHASRGKRFRIGTWPSDNAGLFQAPCY